MCISNCMYKVCLLFIRLEDDGLMMDINKLRHKLFTQKNVTGDKLPPTLDALTLHLRRANYQCFIWRFACNPLLELPSPLDNGWKRVEGIFEQERMSNAAVPDVIVELTRCNCKKGCKTNICSCFRAKLVCTDACSCDDGYECENLEIDESEESSDEDD